MTLEIAGDITSFGDDARESLAANLRRELACVEPSCVLDLRVSAAGSLIVNAIATIPVASGSNSLTAVGAAVASAASVLAATGSTSLEASLGVTVLATPSVAVATGQSVAIVVAPPPPSSPPPSGPSAGTSDLGIVIGASAAGAVAALALALTMHHRARVRASGSKRNGRSTRALGPIVATIGQDSHGVALALEPMPPNDVTNAP